LKARGVYPSGNNVRPSTPEIEVVANAMLESPTHPRKQVKFFTEMSEYDHQQTSGTEYL
jgi:hypothetical protein